MEGWVDGHTDVTYTYPSTNLAVHSWKSNSQPVDKLDVLTTTPPKPPIMLIFIHTINRTSNFYSTKLSRQIFFLRCYNKYNLKQLWNKYAYKLLDKLFVQFHILLQLVAMVTYF